MHRRMITRGLNVSQNVVRLALRFINPVEVENRRQRRLKRRTYANPGPNFCWHVDGYDKLKPYGFAIHGCIDGFSRKVLWLHVSNTNNNPKVTALYFVRAVLRYKTQPMLVRCDRGSENVHIEKIQKFMRRFICCICSLSFSCIITLSTRQDLKIILDFHIFTASASWQNYQL